MMSPPEKERTINTLVDLARNTVENYVLAKQTITPSPEWLPDFAGKQAGIFVSIYLKDKSLRGCIGTIQATQENILYETINNAISAATRDPRFPPIQAHELENLVYSVSVLHEPEQIDSIEQLDHQKYGVIVTSDHRRGLLLPAIESVRSVQEQLMIAMQKAGIKQGEPIRVYRFTVDEFKEAPHINH